MGYIISSNTENKLADKVGFLPFRHNKNTGKTEVFFLFEQNAMGHQLYNVLGGKTNKDPKKLKSGEKADKDNIEALLREFKEETMKIIYSGNKVEKVDRDSKKDSPIIFHPTLIKEFSVPKYFGGVAISGSFSESQLYVGRVNGEFEPRIGHSENDHILGGKRFSLEDLQLEIARTPKKFSAFVKVVANNEFIKSML